MRKPARASYYPWIVVPLAFVTVGVAFGCRSTFGVFLVAVIEEFGWSRAATSGALFGPWLGGHLFDRLGNYNAAFWSANVLAAVSVGLIWAAAPRHFRLLQ